MVILDYRTRVTNLGGEESGTGPHNNILTVQNQINRQISLHVLFYTSKVYKSIAHICLLRTYIRLSSKEKIAESLSLSRDKKWASRRSKDDDLTFCFVFFLLGNYSIDLCFLSHARQRWCKKKQKAPMEMVFMFLGDVADDEKNPTFPPGPPHTCKYIFFYYFSQTAIF